MHHVELLDELAPDDSASQVGVASTVASAIAPETDDVIDPVDIDERSAVSGSASAQPRVRRWAFTVWPDKSVPNQTTEQKVAALKQCLPTTLDSVRFVVMQVERSKNNVPHVQGYLETHNQAYMSQIKSLFAQVGGNNFARTVHVAPARTQKDDDRMGTVSTRKNIEYCTKEINFSDKSQARFPGCEQWRRIQGLPSAAGCHALVRRLCAESQDKQLCNVPDAKEKKQNDAPSMDDLAAEVTALLYGIEDPDARGKFLQEPMTLYEIEFRREYNHLRPAIVRFRKNFLDAQLLIQQRLIPIEREVFVEVIIGPPGVGKTHCVMERFGRSPNIPFRSVVHIQTAGMRGWWQGYGCMGVPQPVVVFDDFGGEGWYPHITCVDLLAFCDKYPTNVQIKHGHMPLNARHVIFISNLPINRWFGFPSYPQCSEQEFAAFKNRINVIREVTGDSKRTAAKANQRPWPSTNPDYHEDEAFTTTAAHFPADK